MHKFKRRIMPYYQAMPVIFKYQLVTKLCIALWMAALGRLFHKLLQSTGRGAVGRFNRRGNT